MGDELVCSLDEKHLSNMRVVDLKQELEKRGLSKSGSKKDLVKRLKQQLQFEKLCEGATSVKDNDSKLDLDEATEQNEFVQRYLAEKQKIYAEHKEAQRLIELREQQDSTSSANEDAADESDSRDIYSTQEADIISSSISSKQNVEGHKYCSEESSNTDNPSSTKEENDANVSGSVRLGIEKSDSVTDNTCNKESTLCSVKFIPDEAEHTEGEVNFQMKIQADDKEYPHHIDKKTEEALDEEANLPSTASESRDKNPPTSVMESVPFTPIEYSLSDIQLPDAPGGKSTEYKTVLSKDAIKSPANGEDCVVTTDVTNVNISDKLNDSAIDVNKLECSQVDETPRVISEDRNPNSTQTIGILASHAFEVETEVTEVQMNVTECEGNVKASKAAEQLQSEEISSGSPCQKDVRKSIPLKSGSIKKEEKLSHSKSSMKSPPTSSRQQGKKLEVTASGDAKTSLRDSVGGDEHPKKPSHKRKNHRTRHSSSHSSSGDSSSTPERELDPSDVSGRSNSVSRDPPSPASSRSRSHSKSPPAEAEEKPAELMQTDTVDMPKERRRLKINRNTVIKAETSEIDGSKAEQMEIVSVAEKSIEQPMDHSQEEKNLEEAASCGAKASRQDSRTGDESPHISSVVPKKMAHKRKSHRTRHSSSQSSSGDSSSTPEREHVPSELSGQSTSALPDSLSSSQTKSPLSEKCVTFVRKVSIDNVPRERKRLKINRNTVIKAEPAEIPLSKVEPMEISLVEVDTEPMDVTREPLNIADTTLEKDLACSGEVTQVPETARVMTFTRRKMTIASQKSTVVSDVLPETKQCIKKRKWGNCVAALSQTSLSISSDSLKSLIPDIKPLVEAPVMSDPDDLSPSVLSEAVSPTRKEHKLFNLPVVEVVMEEDVPEKISKPVVKETPLEVTEATICSPPHNHSSSILFITNLVRPFTLLQLKNLLKQTGNIVEDNFWIDKIKSKCFVMYENEEQAVKTRSTLHGLRWPSSNPKILSVDFASQDELDAHKSGNENPKLLQTTLPPVMERLEVKKFPPLESPKKKEREERKKDKERHRTTVTHVREWDKDKLTQDSPERVPSQHMEKDAEKTRSAEKKKEKRESKRRQDDDAPAKLLDDLFRKTKASPCIYWLPLTEEQTRKREEERQARRLERERKWQQQKEQEESERKSRMKGRSGREKENRRSQSRSRSPIGRRR